MGFYVYGLSVVFKPLAASLGLNRAATSVGAGLGSMTGGIVAPLSGWLVDHFGPKWVMFWGSLMMAAGMMLVYSIQSAWSYYLVWVLISAGGNLGMTIPMDKIIVEWFAKKRGLALSIKFTFIGLGGIILVPVITLLSLNYGWQAACVLWGVFLAAACLLVVLFIRQKGPQYYGLVPDGVESRALVHPTKGTSIRPEFHFTLKQAMGTAAFWIILIVTAGQALVGQSITVHTIPFLTDLGIDPVTAGVLMSMMIFFSIPTRVIFGVLSDRLKREQLRYLLGASIGVISVGITALLIAPGMISVYIFLLCFGIGSGIPVTLSVLMRGQYFGVKSFGKISGVHALMTAPVGLIAPIYAGWIFDSTGSYTFAFSSFAILAAACAVLICFAPPPRLKEQV